MTISSEPNFLPFEVRHPEILRRDPLAASKQRRAALYEALVKEVELAWHRRTDASSAPAWLLTELSTLLGLQGEDEEGDFARALEMLDRLEDVLESVLD